VQGLLSSHAMSEPTQVPSSQWSVIVQASPSSQLAPESGSKRHPASPSQLSKVQVLPSLQLASSTTPSQLSSTPLQISSEGTGASQSDRPASRQTRLPLHSPQSLPTVHPVHSPRVTAFSLQGQIPVSATHCDVLIPSTVIVVPHENPQGQSGSSAAGSHWPPQKPIPEP
jgi:hypothetical protein